MIDRDMPHIDRRSFFVKGATVVATTGLAASGGLASQVAALEPAASIAAAPHAFFDGVVRIGSDPTHAPVACADDFS